MKNMDERTRERMEEIKLLLAMSGLSEFYADDEVERIARLPIELSLPLLTQLSLCKYGFKRSQRGRKRRKREIPRGKCLIDGSSTIIESG